MPCMRMRQHIAWSNDVENVMLAQVRALKVARSGCAATISCSTRQSAPGTPLGMQRQRSRLRSFISLQMWSRSTSQPPRIAFWKALTGGPAEAAPVQFALGMHWGYKICDSTQH